MLSLTNTIRGILWGTRLRIRCEIVPLYIKTPRDCLSSGVSRFNEASPWKMGFNVSEDEAWVTAVRSYLVAYMWNFTCTWLWRISKLGGVWPGNHWTTASMWIAKLISWDTANNRTRFREGEYARVHRWDIGACHATGVLKIGSVYRQGLNYHLQVFLKECKYRKRDVSFKSQLSDDESRYSDDGGYDTVNWKDVEKYLWRGDPHKS